MSACIYNDIEMYHILRVLGTAGIWLIVLKSQGDVTFRCNLSSDAHVPVAKVTWDSLQYNFEFDSARMSF